MAVMGALCAPMAYITLRNKGQSAPTAILASLLIALGNFTFFLVYLIRCYGVNSMLHFVLIKN